MLYRLLWRPHKPLRAAIRLASAAASAGRGLQELIQLNDLAQLPQVWEEALRREPADALGLRHQFYERLRTAGFPPNSDWSLAIFGAIPPRSVRFADYQYATELLIHLKRWRDLHKFLVELAPQQPTLWQQLFLGVLGSSSSNGSSSAKGSNNLPAQFALETLAVSCVSMGLKLDALAADADLPVFEMLRRIAAQFAPGTVLDAVRHLADGNMVLAAPLATSLLSAQCNAQMQDAGVPGVPGVPASEPGDGDAPRHEDSLVQRLWGWKLRAGVATPEDLHIYMLYLVYRRRPREALQVYDRAPALHDAVQGDAVLLAAAGDADFIRLQQTFEAVESDPSAVARMGSRRYATVLRALGYIGDANVLDDIYARLQGANPALLTRGVFHALIQAHGLRGDLTRARGYYDAMMARSIAPTTTTFRLVLRAYKDAKDLRGALQFVGDEMVARHQFGLGNAELTLLLALCAARHDAKTAEYVWRWGTSMCVPDQLSWQARVHCHAQANRLEHAWRLFDELCAAHRPTIDTLTALLQAAARYGDGTPFASRALATRRRLGLRGDAAWYVAVLQYYVRVGDVPLFEATLTEMRTQGVRANASHYALYSQLLAQTKQFERARELPEQMARQRVPVSHAFIGKHLRMLAAPGTSVESALSAERTALQHLRDGYFDPRAAMVPRGIVPVRNVKPIVRRLIKRGNLGPAKKLLDSLRTARGAEKPLDTHELWALYIEVAYAARKYVAVEKLWEQFLRDAARVFVLARGAERPGDAPVYRLSRRHRHAFWREVNAKLDSMARLGRTAQFTAFPAAAAAHGIALTTANWNMYIMGLLRLGEPAQAFEVARRLYYESSGVSRKTFDGLRRAVGLVDAKKYGKVGATAQMLADRFPVRASSP